MRKTFCIAFPITVLASLFSAPTFAASSSANLSNSATVPTSCTLAATQNLLFGQLNTLNEVSKTAQGGLSVECTKGTYALSVNYGQASSIGNVSNFKSQSSCVNGTCVPYATYDYYCGRSVKGSAGSISYTLYTNAGMTTEANQKRSTSYYGNTDTTTSCSSPSTDFGSVVFTQRGAINVPVYARLNATKNTPAGTYTDALTFTITF